MQHFKSKTFSLFILILSNFTKISSEEIISSKIIQKYFEDWQVKYNTKFTNDAEKLQAFTNFEANFKRLMLQKLKYFKGNSQFLIELNSRACDENKGSWTGAKFTDQEENLVAGKDLSDFEDLPEPPLSLDYREMGYVTPVEDQGVSCSSCYAFAAACGLEGQIAKKYGQLIPLSKQMIVDCSDVCGNFGCDGGFISTSYGYIAKYYGIVNNTAYPYTGNVQNCQYKCSMYSANIKSYKFVNVDENYLKRVLAAVGPLPVGMRGSLDSFYFYSAGIYDDPECDENLDHAVCLVGYGTDNTTTPPTDYWIVKNSWSTDWGENGYFRLKMGSNLCGIRNYVVYPLI